MNNAMVSPRHITVRGIECESCDAVVNEYHTVITHDKRYELCLRCCLPLYLLAEALGIELLPD